MKSSKYLQPFLQLSLAYIVLFCEFYPSLIVPGFHLVLTSLFLWVLSFKCNCLLCYFELQLNVVLHFLFKVQPKKLLFFLFLKLNA